MGEEVTRYAHANSPASSPWASSSPTAGLFSFPLGLVALGSRQDLVQPSGPGARCRGSPGGRRGTGGSPGLHGQAAGLRSPRSPRSANRQDLVPGVVLNASEATPLPGPLPPGIAVCGRVRGRIRGRVLTLLNTKPTSKIAVFQVVFDELVRLVGFFTGEERSCLNECVAKQEILYETPPGPSGRLGWFRLLVGLVGLVGFCSGGSRFLCP
jgi:hypothetical protein